MKYPVIKKFRDKYTKIRYKIGDIYETEDIKRAEYLQSKNALGEQVDKPADKPELRTGTKPESWAESEPGDVKFDVDPGKEQSIAQHDTIELIKTIGGGWYELPNGTRIQGKENAENAFKNALKNGENALNGGDVV